jgi:hypothetical protein
MADCYNFTINETNKHMNHCLDKCIQNIDDDYYDDYNKGARDSFLEKAVPKTRGLMGAEALANKGARGAEALVNDCVCKCIYNNNLKDDNDTTDSNSNVFIIFFVIILFLLIFCAYGIMKVKIQQLYMNTNEINNITAITSTTATTASNTIIDLEANNINYYTIDNSQQLPKYNDIEPNISLPPKYDNTIKSNYTNELM